MAVRNEYNEISKVTNKVLRSRMDPLSKLFLVAVIGIPLLIILAIYTAWKVYKCFVGSNSLHTNRNKIEFSLEKLPSIPKTDTVYYEVKKVRSDKYSLTQYVKFSVIQKNEFVDITRQIKSIYPELKFYSGRSSEMAGTVVLTDYDIVQLKKNLGKIKLVRTVGD